MRLTVRAIKIPAMSTIGYGLGVNEEGKVIEFVGDHRPMRHLGESLKALAEAGEPAPEVDVDDWQIVGVREEGR